MMRDTIILRVVAKLLLPAILIFAFYVQFHGDFGPGGGFQAGVAAAGAIILYGMIFGIPAAKHVIPTTVVEIMVPLGVLIFAGTGVVSMMLGENYLNYSPLRAAPGDGQHMGILIVEAGVFITVASTMLAIFYGFGGLADEADAEAAEAAEDGEK